jgi:hypothetical protein
VDYIDMIIDVDLENAYGKFAPGDEVRWPSGDALPLLETMPPQARRSTAGESVGSPEVDAVPLSPETAEAAPPPSGPQRKR